jgi:hypothetical protein
VPASADLNATFAAIAASLNGIENVQIAPNAAIVGSKVAALATANFEDGAIGGAQLADGAATVLQQVDTLEAQSTSITGTEVNVESIVLTRAGGGLLLLASCTVEITGNATAPALRARLLDGASPLSVGQTVQSFVDTGRVFTAQINVMEVLAPASGAKTYHLGITRLTGTTTMVATGWQLLVWELR